MRHWLSRTFNNLFQNYLPKFVEAIWHLLVSTEKQAKHDIVSLGGLNFCFNVCCTNFIVEGKVWNSFVLQVVSNAIGFLASASERNHYKYLFEKQETLKSICENVVVPNTEFRGEFDTSYHLHSSFCVVVIFQIHMQWEHLQL